jgi:hypothetical protein
MAPTVSNIVVGMQTANTVKVGTYGTVEGSCTELGFTEGGIEITNVREYFEKKADQYIGVLGVVKTSERPTVKFSIAEATLDNMRLGWDYPAAALVGSVLTVGGNPTATELTLFINCNSPSGGTRKYEFLKVIPISGGTHSYKKDDKTMIEFEFLVMQDTTAAANEQMCIITDSGVDTTAPTIVLDTPADGGTVTKDTKGTVMWQITEAGIIDENSLTYGDEDNSTFSIINITTPGSEVLVAGSLTYDAALKQVTFTPDANWTASDKLLAIVNTNLRDQAGNHLAAMKIENFSVTA